MPAEPKPPWDQWGQTTDVAAQSEPGKNKLLYQEPLTMTRRIPLAVIASAAKQSIFSLPFT